MGRALRFEYPGAEYHVMARGNGGKMVFETDDDRLVPEAAGSFRTQFCHSRRDCDRPLVLSQVQKCRMSCLVSSPKMIPVEARKRKAPRIWRI